MSNDPPEQYAGKVGNPGRDMIVIPGGEGTPIPESPLSWAANSKAHEIWQRLWTVGRVWLSNEAHYDLMRLTCEAIADRDKIRNRVHREALIVVGSTGQPMTHPGWRLVNECEAKVARLLDQAGFSPAKPRVKTEKASTSKLDEMRNRVRAGRAVQDGAG